MFDIVVQLRTGYLEQGLMVSIFHFTLNYLKQLKSQVLICVTRTCLWQRRTKQTLDENSIFKNFSNK